MSDKPPVRTKAPRAARPARTASPEAKPRGPGRPRLELGKPNPSAKTRLIEVAIPLFAAYGYDAVSTGQIARAAGVTQPMVHYHFKTKDRIWYAAIESLMRDLSTRFPNRREELKDLEPLARLKVLTRRFILMSAADTTLTRIIVHESLTNSERLRWLVRHYVSRGFRDFDNAIVDGIKAGQLKDLPVYSVSNTIISASTFTFCLAGMVKLVHDKNVSSEAVVHDMADSIIEILFHGIAA
ncbi:TetR/AcrR family transcriptional regulator [Pararhodobacter sp.]|uniref:TetR/AcrR family transcriptional regulator n=1 Tax=Pararhodobacter sp. TaxID=2127056 RepID=UPI002FE2C3B9|nr:TetR/AcrR family transcriptional regulator [Pseudomonadota bacterium]